MLFSQYQELIPITCEDSHTPLPSLLLQLFYDKVNIMLKCGVGHTFSIPFICRVCTSDQSIPYIYCRKMQWCLPKLAKWDNLIVTNINAIHSCKLLLAFMVSEETRTPKGQQLDASSTATSYSLVGVDQIQKTAIACSKLRARRRDIYFCRPLHGQNLITIS